MIQLDFFQEKTETDVLRDQVQDLRKSQDKLRKALFARHGELGKKYIEIHDRMDVIERHICQRKI